MSPTAGGGNGMQSHHSGHNYSGTNPLSSSSITNGSAVPSSQSVQQLSQVMGNQMGNGANGPGGGGGGSGSMPMSANAMMCVAHSQSAHQLGLHQQLQQRFAAAAAAASSNSYGKPSALPIHPSALSGEKVNLGGAFTVGRRWQTKKSNPL